ncbi:MULTISPECIES: SMI1/KNR4 family protein [unclassified Parvimonas]|uniref:SMI1/KNR4 family protein n=1 Tax=unclassified Parvimonas TaxID=1151464 RepID=UPI002B494E65|nr:MULTISPECIES: SMI1/KNR4 family protein [unclassified Parvimonas]MEB3025337.1 SMI1/KNR4 family protein [Parvimonas sp. M13]MEB3089419.1 SMI1/KNR4 family protein [Parvimonas sp. M20]
MLISKNKVIQNASKILEEDLKIKLPEDYSKFLDKYNGGRTYKSKVKIGRNWDDVCGFNGVGEVNENYSFESMKSMGVLDNYIERGFLPLSHNMLGDYYCLSLKAEDYGSIYLLYHDLLGKKKKLFSSFTEFINNIKSEEIGHIKTMEEREKMAIENGYGYKVELLRPVWKKEIEKFSKIVQEEVIL